MDATATLIHPEDALLAKADLLTSTAHRMMDEGRMDEAFRLLSKAEALCEQADAIIDRDALAL